MPYTARFTPETLSRADVDAFAENLVIYEAGRVKAILPFRDMARNGARAETLLASA